MKSGLSDYIRRFNASRKAPKNDEDRYRKEYDFIEEFMNNLHTPEEEKQLDKYKYLLLFVVQKLLYSIITYKGTFRIIDTSGNIKFTSYRNKTRYSDDLLSFLNVEFYGWMNKVTIRLNIPNDTAANNFTYRMNSYSDFCFSNKFDDDILKITFNTNARLSTDDVFTKMSHFGILPLVDMRNPTSFASEDRLYVCGRVYGVSDKMQYINKLGSYDIEEQDFFLNAINAMSKIYYTDQQLNAYKHFGICLA